MATPEINQIKFKDAILEKTVSSMLKPINITKNVINVEVCKRKTCMVDNKTIEFYVIGHLNRVCFSIPYRLRSEDGHFASNEFLKQHIIEINVIADNDGGDFDIVSQSNMFGQQQSRINFGDRLVMFIYFAHSSSTTSNDESFQFGVGGGDGASIEQFEHDDEVINAATNWPLPSDSLIGLWESLIFDKPADLKSSLIRYAESILWFAAHRIDPHLIRSNQIVLLHGPPGTGKTSLCRALAQKLAIRLCHPQSNMKSSSLLYSVNPIKFTDGARLIEINSHSLFSKWFAESGKLVSKMIGTIAEYVANRNQLIFVLIDEVESLAANRSSAALQSGSEPSDAIRAVNALLTQLDQLALHSPNVLILATSNVSRAIDAAFLDRADVRQLVPPPTHSAIFQIIRSSLEEMHRKHIFCVSSSSFNNQNGESTEAVNHNDVISTPSSQQPIKYNLSDETEEDLKENKISFPDMQQSDTSLFLSLAEVKREIYSNSECMQADQTVKSEQQVAGEQSVEMKMTVVTSSAIVKRSLRLWQLSGQCEGMSGRSLRKLPLLAHTHLTSSFEGAFMPMMDKISIDEFLNALERAINQHKTHLKELNLENN